MATAVTLVILPALLAAQTPSLRVLIDPGHGATATASAAMLEEGERVLAFGHALARALHAIDVPAALVRGDSAAVSEALRLERAADFAPSVVLILHQDPPHLLGQDAGEVLADLDDPAIQALVADLVPVLEGALAGPVRVVPGRFRDVTSLGAPGVVLKLGEQGSAVPAELAPRLAAVVRAWHRRARPH